MKIQAKDMVKWAEMSVVLTGGRNTVRADRPNSKHSEKINALLDYIQNWIDKKGNVGPVKVTVAVPEVEVEGDSEQIQEKIETPPKLDYVSIDALPMDRKIMSEEGYRGLYKSGKKFYSNKIKDGKIDIREWTDIKKVKLYLDNLKNGSE